jgi:hypothetical protein
MRKTQKRSSVSQEPEFKFAPAINKNSKKLVESSMLNSTEDK